MSTDSLNSSTRLRPGVALAVVGVVSIFAAWSASGATFTDVPAKEIVVSAPLPAVPSQDLFAFAIGKSDGQVLTLMMEDTRIKSRHSGDGGATFGTEVGIDPGGPDVK